MLTQTEIIQAKRQMERLGIVVPKQRVHYNEASKLRKRIHYEQTKRRRIAQNIDTFLHNPNKGNGEQVFQSNIRRDGVQHRSPIFHSFEEAERWRDQKLKELPPSKSNFKGRKKKT